MPVPAGAGGSHTVLSGTLVAMPTGADTELAWEFIKTITDTPAQTEFAKYGLMPANKAAMESAEAKAAVKRIWKSGSPAKI